MTVKHHTKSLTLVLTLFCLAGGACANSQTHVSENSPAKVVAIDDNEINRILALSDDVDYGEYLAGECASCHVSKAVASSSVPVIHGAEPAHIVRALLEFRAGTRANTTMGLVANGLDNEEIAAIAHYLSLSAP